MLRLPKFSSLSFYSHYLKSCNHLKALSFSWFPDLWYQKPDLVAQHLRDKTLMLYATISALAAPEMK